ncbi:MAG: carboxyl transferase domain-containing protein [Hydrogeniiclostridium mannosilyticum]
MGNVSAESRSEIQATKGYRRIVDLLDEGTFNEIDGLARSGDGFAEVVTGYGMIDDCPVYAFSQNSDVCGGAMSKAQANKIKKIYALAVKTGAPVIGIYDSAGGKLAEGADILAAYGDILRDSNNLSGVVPQISVILSPCVGTLAMVASAADFVIMDKKAELTIHTDGSEASVECASKAGICSLAVENESEALAMARDLISLLPSNNLSGVPVADLSAPVVPAAMGAADDMAAVFGAVADEGGYWELYPSYGTAAMVALAQVSGATVGLVGFNGVLDSASCSKGARFVRFCDAFSIPVVSFVNASEFSSLREAVKLSTSYAEATTAKITVITGSAYGPVYIALAGRGANADYTMAWSDAVVSAMAPAAAALFLESEALKGAENPVEARKKLIADYTAQEANALKAAAQGAIEDVIQPEETRSRLIANLAMLSSKRVTTLPKKHGNIQL